MCPAGNQLQLGSRIFLHVGVHKRRQCRLQGGEAGSQGNELRLAFLEFGQCLKKFGTLLTLLKRISISKASDLSQLQPFAEPVEQGNAKAFLQLGDFTGKGRLGQIELARGPVEAGMLYNRGKNVQIIEHKGVSFDQSRVMLILYAHCLWMKVIILIA
ncbi:hypothetical protein D3C80_1525120 [compost metagenome]